MISHHEIPPGHRLHPNRIHYLGASEIAAAAGLDPWRSMLSLWLQKSGLVPDVSTTSPIQRRGLHGEAMALEYLREDKPRWNIWRPHIWITDDEHRIACTPDAFAHDEDGKLVNVQIKTVARPAFEKWAGVRLNYQLQVCCENMLTEAAYGILAVLVLSSWDADLHLFRIDRHPSAEMRILVIARQFWADVEEGRQPLPDFSRDGNLIANLFPHAEAGTVLDLSEDNRLAKILPRREELKDAIRGYKQELEGLDAEVKYKLGSAEAAELPGWKIIYKERFVRGFTVEDKTRRELYVKDLREDAA